jgi:hypothetical protein
MEQAQRAIFAVIVGLACAGLGYAWLAGGSQDGLRRGDAGDLTGIAAPQPTAPRQTARLAVAAPQAPLPHQALPLLPHVTVAFRGGLLTVKASGAPLREILSEITRSVGVTFAFSGDAGEQISVDLGPRPVKEVISGLLDRASYGHAFIESAGAAGQSRLERVFLVKQGTTVDGSGQVAAKVVLALPTASVLARPVEQPSPPDEAAMQQQRAVDTLFDACKAQSQGCDTS